MFTGIVQAVGRIVDIESRDGDLRVRVDAGELDVADLRIGDSVCVSGTCLTVVGMKGREFCVDVSVHTLGCTNLGDWKAGARVNLEKSLRFADRLGGHLVSGHVDAVARIADIHGEARSQRWTFDLPAALARFVAAKGSICLDGVSLTVNAVHGAGFDVNLIPHTLGVTTFGERGIGDAVNVEVDLIARYLERLHAGATA